MMKHKFLLFTIVAAVTLLLNSTATCQPVSSSSLIGNPQVYNGKFVEFQGEVVGDIMERGNNAWVNILDNGTAIGIWMKASDANRIKVKGDYSRKGDTVIITGTFHNACEVHGGETDIHAESIEIISRGTSIDHPVDPKKYAVIGILAVISLGLFLIYRNISKPEV